MDDLILLFNRNLKFYREKKGWTQRVLSDVSHVDENYISRIEREKSVPSVEVMVDLALALGLTMAQMWETPKERRLRSDKRKDAVPQLILELKLYGGGM